MIKVFKLKNILLFLFTPVAIAVLAIGCIALTSTTVFNTSISEIRNNVYTFSDDALTITFMSGKREQDYKLDNKTTKLIPFGILTVKSKTGQPLNQNECEIIANGKSYGSDFEINPIDKSLTCDIKTEIAAEKISVKFGDKNYELYNVLPKNAVKYDDIIKLASKELDGVIKSKTEDGVFNAEIYVRLLTPEDGILNKTYWLVSVQDSKNNVHFIAIDPVTKDIAAKKV